MLNLTQVMISNFIKQLYIGYRNSQGSLNSDYADLIALVANIALENIANSDALYHDIEHTILVTLAGQEILRGKQICEGGVSSEDWLQVTISLLCHDIGYVKGICDQDQVKDRLYATGIGNEMISLPLGTTDASLTPYHIDRGKLFIQERCHTNKLIDIKKIQRNIELTRFPVPNDEEHQDTINYPGLVRAADLIGQLSDPRYLQKLPALFYEFAEVGTHKQLGYNCPGDLRVDYPNFFRNIVSLYIPDGVRYLEVTQEGQKILANLYRNLFVVEYELQEKPSRLELISNR